MQKAMALEIVARNKGVLDAVTLSDIRAALESPALPGRTIRNWMAGETVKETSPVKKEIHSGEISLKEQVSKTLDDKLEQAAHIFVDHAVNPKTVKKMSGPQAMTSLGIAVEKMRLLRNLPTAIIAAIPDLVDLYELLNSLNIEMSPAIRQFKEMIEAKHAAANIRQDGEA